MTWPTKFDSRLENYNPMDFPGQQLQASNANTPLDHVLNLNVNGIPGCQRLTGMMVSIGQRIYDVEGFVKLIEAGMNMTSINMSFGSPEEHLHTIEMLREAAKKFSVTMGRYYPLAIAFRLSGRKIKTGRIAEAINVPLLGKSFPIVVRLCLNSVENLSNVRRGLGGSAKSYLFNFPSLANCGLQVELITGEVVRLTTDDMYRDRCSTYTIFVDFEGFAEQLNPGDIVLLDNGAITLKVDIISYTTLTCKIQYGGILGSYKNVFTPTIAMNMSHYTAKDKQDIKMAINNGIDMIIASFVNSADTLKAIRTVLGEKGKHIALVANIQQSVGINNIEEILKVANGIIITRQDIGLDMKAEKLVKVQKNVTALAHQANVPVFLGVDFQGDLKRNTGSLRSELLDLGNCILDGVDCIRFCPEINAEINPEESLALISSACKDAEACLWSQQILRDYIDKTPQPCKHDVAAAIAAVWAAQRCLAPAIIVVTNSGKTAKVVSKYEPRCPIIAITRYTFVAHQLHMFKGIIPLYYEDPPLEEWTPDLEKRYNFGVKFGIDTGFIKNHDPVVIVSGWRHGKGYTHTMKVIYATIDT